MVTRLVELAWVPRGSRARYHPTYRWSPACCFTHSRRNRISLPAPKPHG